MSAIDPSYIRNIRDGLINEQIEANNLEALPEGLVGLYDKELFPPTMKWKERKETLQFFLIFALAQKEISADFAATILGDEWCKVLPNENETTEEKRLKKVNEFIQLHSKRFTSAGEGRFRLYHERFRVYILQKVSERDLSQFNYKFISLCESELKNNTEKHIHEKERYALEFLSTHFFISAMQGEKVCLNMKDAISLKNLAYDQAYWERQVKASKGFEWSKKMLNEMMLWASKFNEDDEVVECALNKVDLYHQEQNDAPRILQLIADGDIETSLERIEKFGGEDKEGLQRKFTLYMLCLMELTLLDSKNQEHAKTSIDKILKHFDENIPANQSDLINWNDFFPSYLMFLMACKWAELGFDYLIVYKRTDNWNSEWIHRKGPYTNIELQILKNCSKEINNLLSVYSELSKNVFDQEANEIINIAKKIASNNVSEWSQFDEFYQISKHLAIQGRIEEVNSIFIDKPVLSRNKNKKLKYVFGDYFGIDNYMLTLIELLKHGYFREVLDNINLIPNQYKKSALLFSAAKELEKINKCSIAEILTEEYKNLSLNLVNDAKNKIKNEDDDAVKHEVFMDVVELLVYQNQLELSHSLLENILPSQRGPILKNISLKMYKNDLQKALAVCREIKDKPIKVSTLLNISTYLFNTDEQDEAINLNKEAIEVIESIGIQNPISISFSFACASIEFLKQNKFNEALVYYDKIIDKEIKTKSLCTLCSCMLDNYNIKLVNSLLLKSLNNDIRSVGIIDDLILAKLFDIFLIRKSIDVCMKLAELSSDLSLTKKLYIYTAQRHDYSKCLKVINGIKYLREKAEACAEVSTIFYHAGQITYSIELRDLCVTIVNKSKDDWVKSKIYNRLSFEIFIQGDFLNCVRTIKEIPKKTWRDETIELLLCASAISGKYFEFINYLSEASVDYDIDNYEQIKNHNNWLSEKNIILPVFKYNRQGYDEMIIYTCRHLTKKNIIDVSEELVNVQADLILKNKCYKEISIELSKQENYNESTRIINLLTQQNYIIESMCFLSHCYYLKSEFKNAELVLEKALLNVKNHTYNFSKKNDFIAISNECGSQCNIRLFYDLVHSSISNYRFEIFSSFSKRLFESKRYFSAIQVLSQFKNIEDRHLVLKGIIDSISFESLNQDIAMNIFKQSKVCDLEKIMQYYSLNQLFFSNLPQEKLDRYNRTLNIQWVLDIKNQLPN